MGIIEGVFFMCVGHWTRTSLPPGLDCFSYRLAGAEPGITHSMAGLPETDCFMVKPKWLGTQWGQTIADMGEMSNLNTTLYQKGLSGFVTSFLNASLSKEQLWGFIEGKNVHDKNSVHLTSSSADIIWTWNVTLQPFTQLTYFQRFLKWRKAALHRFPSCEALTHSIWMLILLLRKVAFNH